VQVLLLGILDMNILYKYCDKGIVDILESLELKLPYVSEVNDPLECLPFFYCPNDKPAIEARYIAALKRKGKSLPTGYEQALDGLYQKGEIQKELAKSSLKCQKNLNQKHCLLSVSKTARNTVMWAHYANKHKGAIIGIDFDSIFPSNGIQMDSVDYSKQRPKINILTDFETPPEAFLRTILIKSSEWKYEQELRTVFSVDTLGGLKKQELACLKNFNGKKTWFLKLNPESIRKVLFGLFTEDSLKQAVRNLIKRTELQHVKLYQAEESKTYTLNLVEINDR
jgi:hypothetical protein